MGGFEYINQLIQVPKQLKGGAAHATVDGMVQRIEPAPAGGHFVTVNGERHYVGEGFEVKVKKGDEVEAGDMLSEGTPNPALITQYKGIGEGRRYFVNEFRKAMAASGMQGHRRNIELLARGLINHVQLTEETDDHVPDDIIPYSTLEHTYKPREGHERLTPKKAVGQYLEVPVLHYTIGTKIRSSMLKDFEEFGVNSLMVHKNPPPFQPHMLRGMYQLQHDPDWMTQMYGSGLKKSLLESVARGATSEERGTSFVPSLVTGNDFGDVANRAVVKPHAPYQLPKVEVPELPEPVAPPKLANHTFFGGRYKLAEEPKAQGTRLQGTPTTPRLSANTLAAQPPVTGNTASPLRTSGDAPQFFPSDNNIMPENPAEPQTPGSLPTEAAAPQATPVGATPPQAQPLRPPAPVTPAQAKTDANQAVRDFSVMSAGSGPTRRLATSRNSPQMPSSSFAATLPPLLESSPVVTSDFTPSPATVSPGAVSASQTASSGESNFSTPFAETPSAEMPSVETPPAETPPAETPSQSEPSAESQIYEDVMRGMTWGTEAMAGVNKGTPLVANSTGISANLGRLAARVPGATAAGKLLGKAALPLQLLMDTYSTGSNILEKGWDQTTDDTAQKLRDIISFKDGWHTLYQAPLQLFNPVENAQMILGGVTQATAAAGSYVTNKGYDLITGTDAKSRRGTQERQELQKMHNQTQQEQLQQRNKLLTELQQGTATMSPGMKQKLQQQADEAGLRANEANLKAEAQNDETASWQLGKQNWLGGGHKFRDAISATNDQNESELKQLQSLQARTPEQESQLERLRNQKTEYNNLLNLYKSDVGYFGTGHFDDAVRTNVRAAKVRMVELDQAMRSPAALKDPKYKAQLEQDRADAAARLSRYRAWAERAK